MGEPSQRVRLELWGFGPGCLLFIGAGLWLTSHPAPGYQPLFSLMLCPISSEQASACRGRKGGELQSVTSGNHLLVQEWKAGSRWEDGSRSRSSIFFFYLNI